MTDVDAAPDRTDAGTPDPPARADRVRSGREIRRAVPRSAHAELPTGPPDRDPVAVLGHGDADRVAELLPLRYGRMAVSPFAFYRGAAAIMAEDLAGTPVSGLRTQICGDAHLSNFGLFASPERRLVFDLNDFDETMQGPWEWDVKRLAASVEIASRENGFGRRLRRDCVQAAVASYRWCMRELAERGTLDVWYTHLEADDLASLFGGELSRSGRRRMQRNLAAARTKDNTGALRRFVDTTSAAPRLNAEPPLIVPLRDLPRAELPENIDVTLPELLARYADTLPPDRRVLLDRFRLVDMARKVVGVGSVGTRCWMLLLLGDGPDDPLFLQAKEAGPSVLEPHLGPGGFDEQGRRVVVGQRLMQTVGDIFLGSVRVTGVDGKERDYYLRQLRDWKASVEPTQLRPAGMAAYARLCGWTLARAHARSGDRIAIASYLGQGPTFDTAIGEFARAYADRNAADHRALTDAIAAGRVAAAEG